MDNRDARTLGVLNARETDGRSLDADHAVVVDVHAGEDFHQCRFAGAVLAHQRVHFAAHQVEVDVTQRRHAGERLGDAFRVQDDGMVAWRRTSGVDGESSARS
jgi:hypothetical protein